MANKLHKTSIEFPDGTVLPDDLGGASVHVGDDPPAGTLDHGALWIDTDDVPPPPGGPWGIVGYAEQFNEQLNISSPGSNITGLTVVVDVPGGRMFRAFSEGILCFGVGALSSVFWRINLDGSEVCRDRTFRTFESNERWHVQTSRAIELTAGIHTFQVQCECTVSDLRMEASAPAILLIEDIGAAI